MRQSKFICSIIYLLLISLSLTTINVNAQEKQTNEMFIVTLPKKVDVTGNNSNFVVSVSNNANYDVFVSMPNSVNLTNINKKAELIPININYDNSVFGLNESRNVELTHADLTAGYWNAILTISIKAAKVSINPTVEIITPSVENTPTNDDNKVLEPITPIKQFNITYQLDGGYFDSEIIDYFEENKGLELLPKPLKEGCEFNGWILDEKPITNIDPTINRDVVLIATWNENMIETETPVLNDSQPIETSIPIIPNENVIPTVQTEQIGQ